MPLKPHGKPKRSGRFDDVNASYYLSKGNHGSEANHLRSHIFQPVSPESNHSPLLLSRLSSVDSKNCFAFQCFWCCTRTQTHERRPPDQNITINWGSKRFTSNALKWAIWKFDRRMEAFPFGFLLHRLTDTTASYSNMWLKLKRVRPLDINQIPLTSLKVTPVLVTWRDHTLSFK